MKKLIYLPVLYLCLFVLQSKAQNFNYTLTKDSSLYTPLASPTLLSVEGQNWRNINFSMRLPFQFNFCGSSTDSLVIEGNGFIVLDHAKFLSIVAFNNFRSNKDTNENYSSTVSYLTIGSQGNRITKIEFKNLSQAKLSNTDFLNYQVWFYENGNKIEFHIGSNWYGLNPESPSSVLLGIVNRNMDTENKAYLVTGSQYAPTGQSISGDNEFVYLNNTPSEGTILTLTPIN